MTRVHKMAKDVVYQRAHKRAEYKSEAPYVHAGDFVKRTDAAYDPMRDPPLQHADLTAAVMGDPPIGRRAIDQRGEAL